MSSIAQWSNGLSMVVFGVLFVGASLESRRLQGKSEGPSYFVAFAIVLVMIYGLIRGAVTAVYFAGQTLGRSLAEVSW